MCHAMHAFSCVLVLESRDMRVLHYMRNVGHVSLGMCGCSSRVFHALGDPNPQTSMRGHPMAAHLALEPSVARRFSATLCHAFACVFVRFRAFHVLVSENFFEAYKICCCLRFVVA